VTDHTAQPSNGNPALLYVLVASGISGVLGVGAGMLMATIAPGDNFSWAGLAVAPLWLVLEVVFELVVGLFGTYSRIARISVTVALLLGFYAAWFLVRPL